MTSNYFKNILVYLFIFVVSGLSTSGYTQCDISISSNGPTTFCSGSNVELNISKSSGYTIQWRKDQVDIVGQTDSILVVNQSGIYSVIVNDGVGCSSISNDISIHVDLPLAGTAKLVSNYSTEICQNDDAQLLILLNSDTLPPFMDVAIDWYLNDSLVDLHNPNFFGITDFNSALYTPLPRVYYCSISNSCNQLYSDSMLITVHPLPSAEIIAPDNSQFHTLCYPDSKSFFVNSPDSLSYLWLLSDGWGGYYTLPDGTNNSISLNYSGLFSVYITDSNHCSNMIGSEWVDVYPKPNVSIYTVSDTVICEREELTLSVAQNFGW